jgi:hypothetical protein
MMIDLVTQVLVVIVIIHLKLSAENINGHEPMPSRGPRVPEALFLCGQVE